MNDKIKILYVSPEAVPFAGTGGLGDVAGSLPVALNYKKDMDCRLILPLYKTVKQEYREKMEFLGCKNIPVSWRQKYMGVFRLKMGRMTAYFIDNEEYFGRDNLYGYFDDCERFAFFSRAVFEALEFMDFMPDIIHANDWQSAMVPVYHDAFYKLPLKTIMTIHNIEYQGQYSDFCRGDVLGLGEDQAHYVNWGKDINLLKGGITCANIISTVSPTYAQQLRDPFYAHGLDGLINEYSFKLRGILNGIDTKLYDPEKDTMIAANYSAKDISGKAECKKALQEEMDLPVRDVPMIVMISRLVAHKGVDLLRESIDGFLNTHDVQFVLLGTGDPFYEDFFRGLEGRHRDKVRSCIMFDRALSHRIYAAGDILLMPSKSEPCGLSQMIACRYGTVPLVRATGGLNDSIHDCSLGDGNGFVFGHYDAHSFGFVLDNAVQHWYDRENWEKLVKHDLQEDFSWNKAARDYAQMYRDLMI